MSFGGAQTEPAHNSGDRGTRNTAKYKEKGSSGWWCPSGSCSTKTAWISCALNSFLVEDIDSIFIVNINKDYNIITTLVCGGLWKCTNKPACTKRESL